MVEQNESMVSLKDAVITGVVLDLLLLGVASTVLDGGSLLIITSFLVIAHWAGNAAVLTSKRAKQSWIGRDFIRFGLLLLSLLTLIMRVLLAAIGVGF